MLFLPFLSFLIIIPIISVCIILIISKKSNTQVLDIRLIGIITSIVHLCLVLYIWAFFDNNSIDYQFVENITIIPSFSFSYSLGIDGISLIFIFISSLLTFLVLTFTKISDHNIKLLTICVLLILSGSVGTFVSTDILLFYVFYEISIIPVFFIMGKLGSKDNNYASFKFILYTVFGSIFMLIAIIIIMTSAKSSSFTDITDYVLSFETQKYLFLAIFISFAIKSALFPFHTWLPDTYESSPYELNILLSGVLLKFGIYGMIRILLYLFPACVVYFAPFIYSLCLIGMFYAAILAISQSDFKRFFAYFSISHVSLIIAGIFAVNCESLEGVLFQSFSHSIYNTGIFMSLMYLQNRYNTSNMSEFSGLAKSMPKLSICFIFILLAAIALPLTNSFIGELFILFGIFEYNTLLAIPFVFSIILNAIVVMFFNKNIIFGKSSLYLVQDIKTKEVFGLAAIIFVIIYTGIYPNIVLNNIHTTIFSIVETFKDVSLYIK